MKTIVICSQKGGSGKTTLSQNISVAASEGGLRVICVDLDPQQSLRDWWACREADAPAMLERDPSPKQLPAAIKALDANFDLCVIDTPPSANEWLPKVLALADLALIPVMPSAHDVRSVGATVAAATQAKTEFAFVLSRAGKVRLAGETARVLAQHGRVAPENIGQRIAYAEIAATGLGATETEDAKAKSEVVSVWSYVRGLLNV